MLFQAARLRADLHHVDACRVVDVDRRARQPVAGGDEAAPVLLAASGRSAGSASRPAPRRTSAVASPRARLISSEKTAIGRFASTPTYRATPSASEVLPIPGRAARMTRFDGWKPDRIRSSPFRPLGTPVTSVPDSASFSMRANSSIEEALDLRQAVLRAALGDVEDDRLRPVDQFGRRALALVAELRDLHARADEAADDGQVVDDLGVPAHVRDGLRGVDQRVDERRAARRLPACRAWRARHRP